MEDKVNIYVEISGYPYCSGVVTRFRETGAWKALDRLQANAWNKDTFGKPNVKLEDLREVLLAAVELSIQLDGKPRVFMSAEIVKRLPDQGCRWHGDHAAEYRWGVWGSEFTGSQYDWQMVNNWIARISQ